MKKIINTTLIVFFALFVSSVFAQHRSGGRGGGHSFNSHSSARSFSSIRGSVSSRSFSSVNRSNAYRSVSRYRGGSIYSYNRGRVAIGSRYGGGYAYGRGAYANRRVFVSWGAAHRYGYGRRVYFPAYHLFYDPFRCGYTYWYGGRWLFSSVLPAFLAGIDLAAAQLDYVNSIPQAYYPQDGYPADDGYYNNAPVPVLPPPVPPVSLNLHLGL